MIAEHSPTRLRRLTPLDLDAFCAYRDDPKISKYQSWDKMSRTKALEFLAFMEQTEPLIRPNHWTQIAVSDAHDILIGDMGWHLSEDETQAEIGITLAARYHGKGHATRAVNMSLAYLFAHTNAVSAMAYADLRNTPSIALMERVGFERLENAVYEGVDEAVFRMRRASL